MGADQQAAREEVDVRPALPALEELLPAFRALPVEHLVVDADDVVRAGSSAPAGTPLDRLVAVPDLPLARDLVAAACAGAADGEVVRLRLLDARSAPVRVRAGQLLTADAGACALLLVTDDVPPSDALHLEREHAAQVLDAVPPPLAVLDRVGTVVRTNAAWRRLGEQVWTSRPLAAGTPLPQVLEAGAHEEDRARLLAGLREVLGGQRTAWRSELRERDRDGERWWRAKVGALPDGGAVLTLSDISDLKAVQSSLSHQAAHDPLTGLPNRTVLEERLAAPRARRAVLFLDVDDFKLVNDGYGHEAGDALLRAVASRLRAVLPADALLARFAGDEFVVVVEDVVGEVHALGLADALLGTFLAPFAVGGAVLSVTASVGVALGGHEALLGDADTALFEAKARGRAQHALADERSRGRTRSRLELTQALRRAVEGDELVVHHQPVVDLGDGTCSAVECLVRWERPGTGLVLPDAFLPAAEEAGLIGALGERVLEQAVAQAAAWRAAGRPLAVAVNLSPRQLLDRALATKVDDALVRHGLPASLLRLEVTESAALDSAEAETVLHELQELGIGVAVDDFGTGYSSLARLRHLPGVDTLKVDRTFVRGLPHVQDDVEIVTAVLSLARALGLVVVAEGIETREQRDWLAAAGCELGQGWHFGRALPADALLAHLDATLPAPAWATLSG